MIREPLAEGNRLPHRADPRLKLVVAFFLAGLTLAMETFQGLGAALLLGAGLAFAAGIPLKCLARRMWPANFFFLFLLIWLSFAHPGRPWAVWPAAGVDGFLRGARIGLKGNAVLLAMLALVCTSDIAALTRALQDMGFPRKLTLLLACTYRQIFIVSAEMERMRTSAGARCFVPRMNLHTFRTFGFFVAQSLLRSLDRAERIDDAMVMRGFSGRFPVLRRNRRVSTVEIHAAFLLVVAGAGIFLLDRVAIP